MYLILNENIALRSFYLVPYSYIKKGYSNARGLTKAEFDFLKRCDGNTVFRKSKMATEMLEKHFVIECEIGTKLSKWQEYRNCENRYMPKMNLQITGRCNYNCIHCFNAKDNAPLQSEISLEAAIKLLDECSDCGINAFTITGGEPLAHPHYREIIEEIYKRNMFVFELNTNGFYITQEMLDWMKSIGYNPEIKISFDGLGNHNWMRGYKNAEEITLKAVKLCVDNGFKVMIQMNVNKKNLNSILPSLEMLDEMGVYEVRIIKTTDAPRWKENGGDYTLSPAEYFEAILPILKGYAAKPRKMNFEAWQLIYYCPTGNYYNLSSLPCHEGEYRDSIPLCRGSRGMIGVGANGNVYPCLQGSGWFEGHNMCLGNVFRDGLRKVLTDSPFIKLVTTTIKEKLNDQSDCKTCKFWTRCTGGCPALAVLTSGHYLLPDRFKCIFLKEGFLEKYTSLMEGITKKKKTND